MLLEHAKSSLNKCRSIATDSNELILKIREQLINIQDTKQKVRFHLHNYQQQLKLLRTICKKFKSQLTELDNELNLNLIIELENLQTQLDSVLKLLRETPQKGGGCLYDFVSPDNLELLAKRQARISKFKFAEYYKFVDQFEQRIPKDLASIDFNDEDELELEIDALEQDIITFVKSFTDHYDKCVLLENDQDPELRTVLIQDDTELDAHLDELFGVWEDVVGVREKTLASSETAKDDLTHIKQVYSDLKEYIPSIERFSDIIHTLKVFQEGTAEDMAVVKELIGYYTHFAQSYGKLDSEFARRKQVSQLMENTIQECLKKLNAINNQELQNRKEFLLKNGNYLPEDVCKGLSDMGPLFDIQYTVSM